MIYINFYDLYVNKLVDEDDIHKYIDEWHTTDFGYHYKLYDYLGLTEEQYTKWVETGVIDIK